MQSSNREFSIPLLVNYEDTDAGGVVYYGNYLAYMERVRNAFLREKGYPLSALTRDHKVLFVVTEASLRYLLPAKLDDELEITLGISKIRGASVQFHHQVLRNGQVLVDGVIMLAVLNSDTFTPMRIPEFLRACFHVH